MNILSTHVRRFSKYITPEIGRYGVLNFTGTGTQLQHILLGLAGEYWILA